MSSFVSDRLGAGQLQVGGPWGGSGQPRRGRAGRSRVFGPGAAGAQRRCVGPGLGRKGHSACVARCGCGLLSSGARKLL
jgi:hypothetical protein